jgi:hypothetical protein
MSGNVADRGHVLGTRVLESGETRLNYPGSFKLLRYHRVAQYVHALVLTEVATIHKVRRVPERRMYRGFRPIAKKSLSSLLARNGNFSLRAFAR